MRKIDESKVMHCPKCKEVVSIDNCSWANRVLVSHKTLKEVNSKLSKDMVELRMQKNGTIQALHGQIRKLIDLMNEEQREEVSKLTQDMRETIKYWKNKKMEKGGRKQ